MSVRVATTANITLTNATTSVDGVTLANGDSILVKNQTTGSENGIYIVSTSGAWSRSAVMAAGSNAANEVIFVISGTLGGGKSYQCTNATGSAVVGTNALVFWLYNNNFQLFWASPANGTPATGQQITGVIGGNAAYTDTLVGVTLVPAVNSQLGYVNWNVAGFDFTRDFQFDFCIFQYAGADGIQVGVGGSSAFNTYVNNIANGGLAFSYNTYSVNNNDQFYINGSAVGNLVDFHLGVTYTGEWMTCSLIVRTVGTKKVAYIITGSSNSLDNSYDVSNWSPGGTYVAVLARTGGANAGHYVNSVSLQYL